MNLFIEATVGNIEEDLFNPDWDALDPEIEEEFSGIPEVGPEILAQKDAEILELKLKIEGHEAVNADLEACGDLSNPNPKSLTLRP